MAFPASPTNKEYHNSYIFDSSINAWKNFNYKIQDKQKSKISGDWYIDSLGMGYDFSFPPVEDSIKQYTTLSINHYDLELHIRILVNGIEIGTMSNDPDTTKTIEGWKHFHIDGSFINTESENIVRIEHDNVSADWGNIYDVEFGVNMYGRAPSQPGTSAKDILENNPAVYGNDGLYYIGSDQIYCDMTSFGGGWTMIVSAHSSQSTLSATDARNLTVKNVSGTPSGEAITSAVDSISNWTDLMIYTRGYIVKGVGVGDGSKTIRDYYNMGYPAQSTTSSYSAQAKASSLEVLTGETVSAQSTNSWNIGMGIMQAGNETYEDAVIHFGPGYVPQGFGTRKNAELEIGKIINHYGEDMTGVDNQWDSASVNEQQWFIR